MKKVLEAMADIFLSIFVLLGIIFSFILLAIFIEYFQGMCP